MQWHRSVWNDTTICWKTQNQNDNETVSTNGRLGVIDGNKRPHSTGIWFGNNDVIQAIRMVQRVL